MAGEPAYDERLSVPWWWWMVLVAAAASVAAVALTVPEPLLVLPWLAVVVALGAVAVGFDRGRVVVVDGRLHAGRAAIPVRFLGRIDVLGPAALRHRLGPGADPAAYLFTRWWLKRAVLAEVTDPDDDTPYWLVSSRHPQQLAAALLTAHDATSAQDPLAR